MSPKMIAVMNLFRETSTIGTKELKAQGYGRTVGALCSSHGHPPYLEYIDRDPITQVARKVGLTHAGFTWLHRHDRAGLDKAA